MPTAPLTAPLTAPAIGDTGDTRDTGDTGDTGDTATQTVDERFLELICSDADLVAAEFEAIIAAEWPEPPTRRPRRGLTGGPAGSGRARRPAGPARGPGVPPPQPEIDRWARQRSPPPHPATRKTHETDEAGKGR